MTHWKTALVVEGGAMRGMFSAGVLDVFLEQRFDPFDMVLGTSAGACNLASHVAGQHGRNVRCYSQLMIRREFLDLRRAFSRRHVLDLDWLWDELARVEPLDVDAIVASGKELVVVATSARTGKPVYFEPSKEQMFAALKGSCALPWFYRQPVQVGDELVVDGGVSDPFAVREAYRRGARKIVVVRSRPAAYVKKQGLSRHFLALTAPNAALAAAYHNTATSYRAAVDFVLNPPRDCMIVQVAPDTALPVSRTTQDIAALERTYALGRSQGQEAVRAWRARDQLSSVPSA
jgi:predicted patatin/cPLA2 family phospholipase